MDFPDTEKPTSQINLPLCFALPNGITFCSIVRPNGKRPSRVQLESLMEIESMNAVFDQSDVFRMGSICCVNSFDKTLVLNVANLPHPRLLTELLNRDVPWYSVCANLFMSRESPFFYPNSGMFDSLYLNAKSQFFEILDDYQEGYKTFFKELENAAWPIYKFEWWIEDFVKFYILKEGNVYHANNPLERDPESDFDATFLKEKYHFLLNWFEKNQHAALGIYVTSFGGTTYVPNSIPKFIVNMHIAASIIDVDFLGSYADAYDRVNAQLHELYDDITIH